MCVVASAVAALAWFYDYNIQYAFILAMIVQIVIGYAVNTLSTTYINVKNKTLENERLKEFSKQSAELKCAFCSEVSIVPIRLDIDNEYVCPHCDQRNSVYVNITVARSTTPMNVSSLTTSMVEDDRQAIIEEIQNNE